MNKLTIMEVYKNIKEYNKIKEEEDDILFDNYLSITNISILRSSREGKICTYIFCPSIFINRMIHTLENYGFECTKVAGTTNRLKVSWNNKDFDSE